MRIQKKSREHGLGWMIIGTLFAGLFAIGLTMMLVSFKQSLGTEHSWEDSKLYHLIYTLSGADPLDRTQSPIDNSGPGASLKALSPVDLPSSATPLDWSKRLTLPVPALNTPAVRRYSVLVPPSPSTSFAFVDSAPDVQPIKFSFEPPSGYTMDWRIERTAIAKKIVDYEPVGLVSNRARFAPGESKRLYWFNEIIDSSGDQLYQSWYYRDQLMSRVLVSVRSNRFRASSFKTISYEHQGPWRVATETQDGEILAERRFELVLTH